LSLSGDVILCDDAFLQILESLTTWPEYNWCSQSVWASAKQGGNYLVCLCRVPCASSHCREACWHWFSVGVKRRWEAGSWPTHPVTQSLASPQSISENPVGDCGRPGRLNLPSQLYTEEGKHHGACHPPAKSR